MAFSTDTTQYSLPRGKILFQRKNLSTGVLDPALFMGNAPSFEFSTMGDEIDTIIDWTSMNATPSTRLVKQRIPEFSLKLLQANADNLDIVFMGSKPGEYTQAGGSIVAEAIGVAKVGALYQLAQRGIYGGTQITALTVKKGATAFTTGTEAVLRDATNGIVELVSLHTGVSAGDAITADYTAPAIVPGSGLGQILGGTSPRVEGRLIYIPTSSIGPLYQVRLWNCMISSDSPFPFVSADHAEASLKITMLTDPNHTELFELLRVA